MPEKPVFPRNDCIAITSGGSEERASVLALSAVFDMLERISDQLERITPDA